MRELYLDIMEKALSAYTPQRIRDYIETVKAEDLKEHGFPRLGANIGILIANGRRTDLMDTFVEIMDLCCEAMPRKKAANDFSIREVCCCLMLMEEKKILSQERINKWKQQLAAFDPWTRYSVVDDNSGRMVYNWALFATVSEYMRGVCCGIDTSEFVDHQLPSQLANLDCNDMYQDDPPFNHAVYDLAPRILMAFLLRAGYRGKYAARLEQVLDNTAELTLQMQSVTGELAFGGRSNQFLHNEAMLSAYCELEATRFAEKGDMTRAGQFKAAAQLAAKACTRYLSLEPISHVKNRYPVDSTIGCEGYAYFNKYMITVASNVYIGIHFINEDIPATVAPAEAGGFVAQTSERFHKVFLNAGGYGLEYDTHAYPDYDGSGLGRVHKRGCPSALCLSVPFARSPHYGIPEKKNPSAMSICSYVLADGKKFLSAEEQAQHTLLSGSQTEKEVCAEFEVKITGEITVYAQYTVSEKGVDICQSGYETAGFMLPAFDFDGAEHTKIEIEEGALSVRYQGAVCHYRFDGTLDPEFKYYYNRNGGYRVYMVAAKKLHIEMEEESHEV